MAMEQDIKSKLIWYVLLPTLTLILSFLFNKFVPMLPEYYQLHWASLNAIAFGIAYRITFIISSKDKVTENHNNPSFITKILTNKVLNYLVVFCFILYVLVELVTYKF